MHVVLGLFGLIVWFVLWSALNKEHVKKTGVPMPSRKAMSRIRRNSRQKGISEQAAYDQWVINKRKRMPKVPAPVAATAPAISPAATSGAPPSSEEAGSGWVIALLACVALFVGTIAMFVDKPAGPASPTAPRPTPQSNPEPPSPLPQARKAFYELPALNPGIEAALPNVAPKPSPKISAAIAAIPSPRRVELAIKTVAPKPSPKISAAIAAIPSPRRVELAIKTVALPPPRVRRGRGGCGSRGGPGYRLANGRCASWHR